MPSSLPLSLPLTLPLPLPLSLPLPLPPLLPLSLPMPLPPPLPLSLPLPLPLLLPLLLTLPLRHHYPMPQNCNCSSNESAPVAEELLSRELVPLSFLSLALVAKELVSCSGTVKRWRYPRRASPAKWADENSSCPPPAR